MILCDSEETQGTSSSLEASCTIEPFVADISCLNLGLSYTMFTHKPNAQSISSLLPCRRDTRRYWAFSVQEQVEKLGPLFWFGDVISAQTCLK